MDLDRQPATIEGAFVLLPPNRAKQHLPPMPPDMQPTVGVSVTVWKEGVNVQVPACLRLLPVLVVLAGYWLDPASSSVSAVYFSLQLAGPRTVEPHAVVKGGPKSPGPPNPPTEQQILSPGSPPRRTPVLGRVSPALGPSHPQTESEAESLLEDSAPTLQPGTGRFP